MELRDWIQVGLMFILVVVTAIYAWRTHKISQSSDKAAKATMEQAEATVALASREYIKEFIRLEIYPLFERCSEVKRILDLNYFGHNYETGWPQIYGLPPELSEEEAKVLKIGVFNGREVFSFPDPSLGILQGRYYESNSILVLLHIETLEDEHRNIAKLISSFDSNKAQLDKLLRFMATEIKRAIVPYVSTAKVETLQTNSELDEGQFLSYVSEICFNYLLLIPKDFDTFFKQFDRNQAKNFWEENKSDLQSLVNNEHISEKVNELKELSNRFSSELSQICDSLQACENTYRSKCYITFEELPPCLF